jgi:Skp family chaperone for outer membrane proteins
MKIQRWMIVLASISIAMIVTANAQNPADLIVAPVSQHISQAQEEIQQKVVSHIAQGNITLEHVQKDVNATKETLQKKASEEIKQHSNITVQDVQQKAKEELTNQVNQKVQQPGFEVLFAAFGFFATAYLIRKNN